MSNIRDKVQKEAAEAYLNSEGRGILRLSVRLGKCRTSVMIMEQLDCRRVLIVYPQVKIKDSWEAEFQKMEYKPNTVDYSTYTSLDKCLGECYDLIILDEIDDTSEHQREIISLLMEDNTNILGLTGTLNTEDKTGLAEIGLEVIHEYDMHDGIEDGILPPYQIHVIRCPLDNKELCYTTSKGRKITEKQKYDNYTFVYNKLKEEGKDTFHISLARARFLGETKSRLNRCKRLIEQLGDNRFLFFGASKDFIEKLGIPTYHSTSKDKETFNSFVRGEINSTALVKIGTSGISYKNLDIIVLSKIEGNSSLLQQILGRAMIKDSENKTSKLILVTSGEEAESKRLTRALKGLKSEYITYGI